MNTQASKQNNPNANYAMYERDRENKRKAQSAPSEKSAQVDWKALAISRYERMEEYRLEVQAVTAQRDELLAALKDCETDSGATAFVHPKYAPQRLRAINELIQAAIKRAESQSERTGGANDYYEEQQHERHHFVPEDDETDAERNA